MNENSDDIAQFFREVTRVISKYGLQHVMTELRKIQHEFSEGLEKDMCEYIVSITAKFYTVNTNDLLFSNKRGLISEARRMCYALMKEHLAITDDRIGDYFGGKSRQLVNRELITLPLNQDSYATKDEAQFATDFLELTVCVSDYKKGHNINKDG